MALNRRYLISRLLLTATLFGAFSTSAPAQPAANGKVPPTFRTLALSRSLSGAFYDLNNKPVPFYASDAALSASYTLPANGLVSLYRRVPSPEPDAGPLRVKVAEARVSGEGPHLLIVATAPATDATGYPQVQLKVIDASWTAHPLNSLRVFNLSSRTTVVRIESETVELAAGTDRIFPYPSGTNRTWLRAAFMENGAWKLRVGAPQAIIPGTRSIITLADSKPDLDDPDGIRIKVRNVIDTTPPPEPHLAQK